MLLLRKGKCCLYSFNCVLLLRKGKCCLYSFNFCFWDLSINVWVQISFFLAHHPCIEASSFYCKVNFYQKGKMSKGGGIKYTKKWQGSVKRDSFQPHLIQYWHLAHDETRSGNHVCTSLLIRGGRRIGCSAFMPLLHYKQYFFVGLRSVRCL